MLGFGFLSPSGQWGDSVDVSVRTLLSAVQLQREGVVAGVEGSRLLQQRMVVLPIQLGLQARPRALRWRDVGLYSGLSVASLLALTQGNALAEGRTFLGFSSELSFGVEAELSAFWRNVALPGFSRVSSLALEGHLSGGTLRGELLQASGVRAGLRVAL
jgi:hypothetical protein